MRARLATVAIGLLVGCQAMTPATPPATMPAVSRPSEPPVLGLDWTAAASVERPRNFEEGVSPSYPGTHPILRIAGQATMADVVASPAGGFVAVGYVPPDWTPVAWTSEDGTSWTIDEMGTTEFTFPVAVAGGADGTIVAVGRSRNEPVAWTTRDGVGWERHAVPILGTAGVAERMTTAVATGDGFVAGGSVGPELFDRHARFWTSEDGSTWEPVPDDPAAFADAEARAIATFEGGLVAVGVVGPAQHPTGAVAWTSRDGEAWIRVDEPAFAGSVAVAITAAPFGGVVAVGSTVDRREAVAWTSPDGLHWTRAPGEPSRKHPGGYAWMTDVTSIGDVVLAIGDYQGLQRGTGTSWVSDNGLGWQRAHTAPTQEQAEFYAIAPGQGAVVVGAFGAPDSYVPKVWLTPGP